MRQKWGPFRVTATQQQRVGTVTVRAVSDNTRTTANMVTELHYIREKMGSQQAVLYHLLLLLFNYCICM
jgi:hypothetical protein